MVKRFMYKKKKKKKKKKMSGILIPTYTFLTKKTFFFIQNTRKHIKEN
jgi:hypothetical protein